MSFVLDNSVALGWCFEDEHTEPVMDLLDRVVERGAFAPTLWPLETLNGLLMAQRRKRLDAGRRNRLAGFLPALPITSDLETSDQHGRSRFSWRNGTGSAYTTLPISSSRNGGSFR